MSENKPATGQGTAKPPGTGSTPAPGPRPAPPMQEAIKNQFPGNPEEKAR